MRQRLSHLIWLSMLSVGALLFPAELLGQDVRVGYQTALAAQAGLGVGGRIIADLGGPLSKGFGFQGAFNVMFNDRYDYLELNWNAIYGFGPLQGTGLAAYVGTGLNASRHEQHQLLGSARRNDGQFSDTEIGLNVLFGAEYPLGVVTPFAEVAGSFAKDIGKRSVTFGFLVP